MTPYMRQVGEITFSQNVSSLALTVWELRFVEDIFTKDDSLTQLTSNGGVCRTAQATTGLLFTQ